MKYPPERAARFKENSLWREFVPTTLDNASCRGASSACPVNNGHDGRPASQANVQVYKGAAQQEGLHGQ
eukprot:4451394-Pleurochrysis_carterae.AAC.3